MATLPVYRLKPPHYNLRSLDDWARKLFGIQNYSLKQINGRHSIKSDAKIVDVDVINGAVWAANMAQLWNPSLKPNLSDKNNARKIADEFVKSNDLLPSFEHEHENQFKIDTLETVGSIVSISNTKGNRENHQLDNRVRYTVKILTKDPESGSSSKVHITNGLGKFGVTIGDADEIIGYNGAWLPVEGVETDSNYIPREFADQHFKKLTSNLKIESFDANLAYSYCCSSNKDHYLYPVWEFKATSNIKGHKVPLRIITFPATEFGPQHIAYTPQPKRHKRPVPRTRGTRRKNLVAINPFEAGTSWIGELGGLSGSRNNAQGFVDGLASAGWNVNFNWGNCNAWETDWHDNDDDYVDAADFVFYTGHAGLDGWMLVNPSNCDADFLSSSKVGSGPQNPGDIWGGQDLEWVVVAACGPLQDDILSPGGGDVLQRWDGAFDGLHILMGYGAITFDTEEEGKRLVQYSREGQTIINSWFRTAQEIQPSDNGSSAPDGPTIYVGAMWVEKSGQPSPFNDHIWGYGSVAPDPRSPNILACMWVPC